MKEHLAKNLKTLLTQANAVDVETNYVHFDRVWQKPNNLKYCADLVYLYLIELNKEFDNLLLEDKSSLVIISPDSVGTNLGIIPVSFLVANKIGCHVAVWKELADIRWGTSAVIGPSNPDLICITLQDVVRHGTTALKIANSIKDLKWKFVLYLAAVLNHEEGDLAVKTTLIKVGEILEEIPKFRYILSRDDLIQHNRLTK
jgi:hypothetical protein